MCPLLNIVIGNPHGEGDDRSSQWALLEQRRCRVRFDQGAREGGSQGLQYHAMPCQTTNKAEQNREAIQEKVRVGMAPKVGTPKMRVWVV